MSAIPQHKKMAMGKGLGQEVGSVQSRGNSAPAPKPVKPKKSPKK